MFSIRNTFRAIDQSQTRSHQRSSNTTLPIPGEGEECLKQVIEAMPQDLLPGNQATEAYETSNMEEKALNLLERLQKYEATRDVDISQPVPENMIH